MDKEVLAVIIIIASVIIIAYFIYESCYYSGEDFAKIKKKIQKYIDECNEMNEHIEELKNTFVDFEQTDYGDATNIDSSNYNYKRRELKKYMNSKYVYNCSLVVCRNAQQQPFKYLCKYFNIKPDEETLSKFEEVLNNFAAVEQGKELLNNKKTLIIESIWKDVPWLIRAFSSKRFERELGFTPIDFSQLYFPTYVFYYISSGGNSSMRTNITLNMEQLNKFVEYLSELVKFRKSIAGQRALMTTGLREKIKKRDKYTCQNCKNNLKKEPNLLLEIDHKIPLSKGGITSEENLQTLCWKCNRSKGTKITSPVEVNKQSKESENEEEIENEEPFTCTNCGTGVSEGTKKCPNCGAIFEEDEERMVENEKEKEDTTSTDMNQKYSDLKKLKELLDNKIITKEEFEREKAKILDK